MDLDRADWFWMGPISFHSKVANSRAYMGHNSLTRECQPASSRSVALQVWSLDQEHQHHLGLVRHANSWTPPGVETNEQVLRVPRMQLNVENHCSRSILLKLCVWDPVTAQALNEEVCILMSCQEMTMLLVPGPHHEGKDLPVYRPHSKACEDAGLVRTDLCGFQEKLKTLNFL